MWPKLNTMKHLLTLATLLTSLSAFAQLPYNPDANNDGLIGAFDLTSLLSVYSNTFSNGALGQGVAILSSYAEYEDPDNNVIGHIYSTEYDGEQAVEANSFVFDLTLFVSCHEHNIDIYGDFVNGMTFSLIVPPISITCNDISYHVRMSNDEDYQDFYLPIQRPFLGSVITVVWWNGLLHVLDAGF